MILFYLFHDQGRLGGDNTFDFTDFVVYQVIQFGQGFDNEIDIDVRTACHQVNVYSFFKLAEGINYRFLFLDINSELDVPCNIETQFVRGPDGYDFDIVLVDQAFKSCPDSGFGDPQLFGNGGVGKPTILLQEFYDLAVEFI